MLLGVIGLYVRIQMGCTNLHLTTLEWLNLYDMSTTWTVGLLSESRSTGWSCDIISH